MNNRMEKMRRNPAFTGMILFLGALVVYFLMQFIADPDGFFEIKTYRNITSLFKNFTPLILLTMGQALLMLLGIIDISIGVQMSFANVFCVFLIETGVFPIWAVISLTILASIALATINGSIVSYLRIPPLLAGYAMIFIVKGINLQIRSAPGGKIPMDMNLFYAKMWCGFLPTSVILIALVYLAWKYLSKTPLIKHVYAVGGNERNAFATGINSARTKVYMYMLAGALTGVAGVCYTAAYMTGNPITGEIYGLQSISACILGGIALSGGWGNLLCALYGVGFQLLIQNSVPKIFSMLPGTYNTYWHNLLTDTIILVGLLGTLFVSKSQRDSLTEGLKKQVSRGKKRE